jgi:hypothetical protein
VRLWLDKAVHDGIETQSGCTLDAQLGRDVFAVGEYGIDTDIQIVSYFFIEFSSGDEFQHFNFTGRERIALLRG